MIIHQNVLVFQPHLPLNGLLKVKYAAWDKPFTERRISYLKGRYLVKENLLSAKYDTWDNSFAKEEEWAYLRVVT